LRSAILLQKPPDRVNAPSTEIFDTYTKAKNLFNSGNVADAKRIVDELWKNPKAKTWNPLIQLLNQINRSLNL
jgi:hypothetical protein